MKTAQEYIDSISGLKREAYIFGKKVDNPADHPMIRPSLNAVAATYALAADPEGAALATATSHLSGRPVNRFTHIHQNTADLVAKIKMQRALGQKTATCFQRCVGMDALNALDSVTFEIDKAKGTSYHERFNRFLRRVQDEDLVCEGAMTDVKGDRGKRPSQQDDPDLFVHVVEERPDGLVVRGAKAHQTGALNSHEIIVMPTMAMRPEDADYAVSFAIPADAPGLTFILGRQSSDTRKLEDGDMDVGNPRYGAQECLVILNDVFVPWERVFMYREHDFAGMLVERFAAYHRQSYGGCKAGVGDVLIGATAKLAEYNGVKDASHIRDKLVEMIHLNETLYSCGLACSAEGQATASGAYLVDLLLANVCKLNATRFPYEIGRLAEDIAGGLLVTMPSEADLRHPVTGPLIEKYLKGVSGVSTECRLRMFRLVENLTVGSAAVAYRTESAHGAGSPQAMRVVIARQADLEKKKKLAEDLAAGTKDGGKGGSK
ncbi:MAG: 4-hydroxyphenylacetate 3-hydroxylase family protein [Bacillota bacterium]